MDNDEKVYTPGIISKSASLEPCEVTETDLRKINKLTLVPLTADDVFVFKTVIGDNETDDRNFEPFNQQAIKDLEKAYIGRPLLKDHSRRADAMVGRVYDTELISEPKLTGVGEPFVKMVAKNYVLRTDNNKDLIREIQGGIKKEVSTGVRPKRLICNICGTDNLKSYCPHWPGREYDKAEGKTTCMMTIDGVKEAYELSLVAVPAQPRAGTIKNYGPKPETVVPEKPVEPAAVPNTDDTKDLETGLRIKALESFLFTQNTENS